MHAQCSDILSDELFLHVNQLNMNTVFCQLSAPPLIRVPPSLEEPNAIINGQNRHSHIL